MNQIPSFNDLRKILDEERTPNSSKLKIAILADFSSQLLKVAIEGMGKVNGLRLQVFESEFDQIDLQLLDKKSELHKFVPDWIFLFQSNIRLKEKYYKFDKKEEFSKHISEVISNYNDIVTKEIKANCIITNYYNEKDETFGSFSAKVVRSYGFQLSKINLSIHDLILKSKETYLLDIAGLISREGIKNAIDWRMNLNASMPYSINFLPIIANDVVSLLSNKLGSIKKCAVVDLDGTIWGGIIGDDGIQNIEIGDLGIGKAYKEFQFWLKSLKERGIILAVCSKNEERIAKEPFKTHPEMVLQLDDISVFVANWNNKAENIKYIQEVLNIGFDSMVFLDDNPMERDLINKIIPEVAVPNLPEDPVERLSHLQEIDLFSTTSYTESDADRTSYYQSEAARIDQKMSYSSIEEYLENLNMEAQIERFDKFYLPRIAQLTQRTNQFNLRTKRYSEQDIQHIMDSDDYQTIYVKLRDKFGDHGLISIVILTEIDDHLFIENWAMSCRVFNRGVEALTINKIFIIAEELGFKKVIGEYLPTEKNELVRDLFSNFKFKNIGNNKFEKLVDEHEIIEHSINEKSL